MHNPWDNVSQESLIAGSLFCAAIAFVLFYRSSATRRKMLAVLVAFWASYLDSASGTLRQLRSLRAVLAQFRNTCKDDDLDQQTSQLYQKVSSEIAHLEKELDTISRAPDSVWGNGEIQWRSMIPIASDIQNLLILAEQAIQKANKALAAQPQKPDPAMAAAMMQMETDLKALRDEVWSYQEEKKQVRNFSEEAAAAKLMATLRDDLSLEDIETRIAATNGEIADCRRRIPESEADPDEQGRLADRQEWFLQVMRWWEILKKLRTKTSKPVQITDILPDTDRTEEVMEFQAVEAENAELRRKLGDQQLTNRRLSKELDSLDANTATAEQLREVLTQVDMARKMSQRELANLEKMFDQLEAEVTPLRIKVSQMDKIRTAIEETKTATAKADQENQELKRNLQLLHLEMDNAVDSLQKMIDQEIEQKQMAEEESLQIQKAYDDINAKLIQQRSARSQLEKNEIKIKEELKNLKAEHQELQAKFRELRDSTPR